MDLAKYFWMGTHTTSPILLGIGIDIRNIKEAEKKIARQAKMISSLYDAAQRLTEKFELMGGQRRL